MKRKPTKRRRKKKTPIRQSLRKASFLHSSVEDGIGALERAHRRYLASDIRGAFGDSLDLDKAMQEGHEQQNRWDYLLGHTQSVAIVGLEPHSAKQDQVTTIIQKKDAARQQLTGQLKQGEGIANWIWVASGKVYLTQKERLRLSQRGIQFVGRKVLKKHLPVAKSTMARRRR